MIIFSTRCRDRSGIIHGCHHRGNHCCAVTCKNRPARGQCVQLADSDGDKSRAPIGQRDHGDPSDARAIIRGMQDITAEILRDALYGKTQTQHPLIPDLGPMVPRQVRLAPSSVPGEKLGVVASTWIKEGTEMGPLPGRLLPSDALDPFKHNPWVWELFDPQGQLLCFLDYGDNRHCCWLCYVNCARHEHEQNLEIIQNGKELFFRAKKDIPPEEELLVWYGPSHRLYLGFPGVEPVSTSSSPVKPRPSQSEVSSASALRCVLCHRAFNSRSNLRSHMRTHTLERPFACRFCQRRFSQSSTLRNHVRLHTGEKPYKCLVCRSAYSQLAGLRAHQKSARHRPPAVTLNNKT